jgi:hypothetical protein
MGKLDDRAHVASLDASAGLATHTLFRPSANAQLTGCKVNVSLTTQALALTAKFSGDAPQMSVCSNPDKLDELALRAGADIRSPLLRALVDLYLQKPTHTEEEAQYFTELTLRLLDEAGADTRRAMERRLLSYPSVPAAILRRLAVDAPAAAARPMHNRRMMPRERTPTVQNPTLPAELCELFFAASAVERRLILLNLAYAPAPAEVVSPAKAGVAASEIETAALSHNPDAFVRALERCLGIAPALARRIVHDPFGEPIVVVAKVFGVAPDALQRMLLFVNPVVGRSVNRVYELATLFESIGAHAAHVMAGIWREADPRPAAAGLNPPGDRGNAGRHDPQPRESRRPDRTKPHAPAALQLRPRVPGAA